MPKVTESVTRGIMQTARHPLTAYRKSAKLTQRELAEHLGVARETIGRWETGKRAIDDELLPRVAKVTGIAKAVLRPDLAALLEAAR